VHLLALMISTCILPNIEAVSNIHNVAAVQESPHDGMRCYVEMAWILSTGVGILLFLIQMAILAWVRFNGLSSNAPIASTVVIVPALVVFIAFAVLFYRQLVAHKVERSTRGLEEIESIANQLDVGLRSSSGCIQNV
jgi:calcium release-activated calcium channel protein 1